MIISKNNSEPRFKKMMLIKSIMKSYHKVESELRIFLKPYGITLQQYNVLKILKGAKKPLSTSMIRNRMVKPMADSSRLVDRLSAKGWVERVASSSDRRLVDVTISKAGTKTLGQLTDMESIIEKLYEKLNRQEAITLNRLLNKLSTD